MLHVLKLAYPVLKDFKECFSQLLDASCASELSCLSQNFSGYLMT